MGPKDDVEVYLETFERSAVAARWPREHWAAIVGSYLSREAQGAVKAMDSADATDYDKLKTAVLDRFKIDRDTYQYRFHSYSPLAGACPRAMVAALKDAAFRWLCPKMEGEQQQAEMVVVEQLLSILPPRTRHWMAC